MKALKRFEYRVRDLLRSLGLDAERVPLSGSSSAMKGDVVSERYLVECKYTGGNEYITVRHSWLIELEELARKQGKFPVLMFTFGNSREIYAVPLRRWLSLLKNREGRNDEREK